jgi:hypothetical protein
MEEFANLESTRFVSQISLMTLSKTADSQGLENCKPCFKEINAFQIQQPVTKTEPKKLQAKTRTNIKPTLIRSARKIHKTKTNKKALKSKIFENQENQPKPEVQEDIFEYSLFFVQEGSEKSGLSFNNLSNIPEMEDKNKFILIDEPVEEISKVFPPISTKIEETHASNHPKTSVLRNNHNAIGPIYPSNSANLNNFPNDPQGSDKTSIYKDRLFNLISSIKSGPRVKNQVSDQTCNDKMVEKSCRQTYEDVYNKEVSRRIEHKNPYEHQLVDYDLSLRYSVHDFLGKGSFASVRIGYNRLNNQKVAIKTYDNASMNSLNKLGLIRNEIKALKRLTHKSVNKLHDIVANCHHTNLILQIIEGQNLNLYISKKDQKRISENRSLRIFTQVVNIIDYCHSECVFHRDIKLSNIMINKQKEVFLIDFGFALVVKPDHLIKNYCGTLHYMAPELILNQPYEGAPADVWALGVLLFKMASGEYPFKGCIKRLFRCGSEGEYHKGRIYNGARFLAQA